MAALGLPALVSKALADTGFDLVTPTDEGWVSAAVSGTPARVAVKPSGSVTWLAVCDPGLIARIGLTLVAGVPPAGMHEIGQADRPRELYEALRLLHALGANPPATLSARLEARLAAIPETERTQEVRQRVGQDVFREALMELWQGRCAVTGLPLPRQLLRASHAKPWADATDAERLDPFNGLLLAIHLDAMFDSGLIAFDDDGRLLKSRHLDFATSSHFGLEGTVRLRTLSPGHVPYLQWHRHFVFKGQ